MPTSNSPIKPQDQSDRRVQNFTLHGYRHALSISILQTFETDLKCFEHLRKIELFGTQRCFVRPAERPLNDGRAAARREVRVGWVGRIEHPQTTLMLCAVKATRSETRAHLCQQWATMQGGREAKGHVTQGLSQQAKHVYC